MTNQDHSVVTTDDDGPWILGKNQIRFYDILRRFPL